MESKNIENINASKRCKTTDVKVTLHAALGVGIEFYDFVVFILFSSVIAGLFFPATKTLAFSYTFLIFVAGYLARPLGGIILAHIGDKYGRKNVFLMTIILMTVATFFIGIIPPYKHIGIWAPILLLILRCMQGVALGGEVPASITFIYEHVDGKKHGMSTAVMFSSFGLGTLIASLICYFIYKYIPVNHLLLWGWRLPFFIGGIFSAFVIYVRFFISETDSFQELQKAGKVLRVPFVFLLKNYKKSLLIGFFIAVLLAVTTSFFYMFLPVYLAETNMLLPDVAQQLNVIGLVSFIILIIGYGYIIDRYKVDIKKMYIYSALFLILTIIPILIMFKTLSYFSIAYLLCGISIAGTNCAYPIILAKMFPVEIRFSAIALIYNVAYAVFGSLTPLFMAILFRSCDLVFVPSLFIIAVSIIVIGFLFLKPSENNLPADSDLSS